MATAYVYNLKSRKAVLIIKGDEEYVEEYLDDLPEPYCDLNRFSVTFHPKVSLKGIAKHAKTIIFE